MLAYKQRPIDPLQAVYESIKPARKRPWGATSIGLDPLVGKKFRLSSTDYVESVSEFTGYIEFLAANEDENKSEAEANSTYPAQNEVKAPIYFDSEHILNMKPFTPPAYAGLTPYNPQVGTPNPEDGNTSTSTVTVQFLSNLHLDLKVPRRLINTRNSQSSWPGLGSGSGLESDYLRFTCIKTT
ncbi:hypothetical protein BDV19DRAFT_357727 [Aspergillus venezuelensis]